MSSKNIELSVLGQMLRLNCPEEQHEALRQAARDLDQRVTEMKDRTGILQVERALLIVALNLGYELLQAKEKNSSVESLLKDKIQFLDDLLGQKLNP